jgi:hypothetical protein
MTLMVFLGVLVSLLILRLIPGLMLRLVLAIPRHRMAVMMRWIHGRPGGIALPRNSATAIFNAPIAVSSAPSGARVKLFLVTSSVLVLVVLATTAFWSWHSTALMMLVH